MRDSVVKNYEYILWQPQVFKIFLNLRFIVIRFRFAKKKTPDRKG
jgi:hypothetical protein